MDKQTYLYMKERVNKAEEIQEKIEHLSRLLLNVKGKRFQNITINYVTDGFRTTTMTKGRIPDVYSGELEARMINALIDVTKAEISRLEQELAEL
ncbi:hypothetical protein BTS2_0513 [Bacillus sp. TS-2]|nr:hypothetical protein BTS2_0513 [Bacillus sp. TS-2]